MQDLLLFECTPDLRPVICRKLRVQVVNYHLQKLFHGISCLLTGCLIDSQNPSILIDQIKAKDCILKREVCQAAFMLKSHMFSHVCCRPGHPFCSLWTRYGKAMCQPFAFLSLSIDMLFKVLNRFLGVENLIVDLVCIFSDYPRREFQVSFTNASFERTPLCFSKEAFRYWNRNLPSLIHANNGLWSMKR